MSNNMLIRKYNSRAARMCFNGDKPPSFEEYLEDHRELYTEDEIKEAIEIMNKKNENAKKKRTKSKKRTTNN